MGIHTEPKRKLGRRKPKNAPALHASSFLTGTLPTHGVAVDHLGSLQFDLGGNDTYGDCGPVSVANLVRLVTGGLLGTEVRPSLADIYDLYRRSGNPNFKPGVEGTEDNGVDMQTMLEELQRNGIGDGKGGKVKPLCFAKLSVRDDTELEAAVAIFGGALWGVNLLTPQQSQTDAVPPIWDWRQGSEWGGHAIVNGAFEVGKLEDVISWAIRVGTTAPFRVHQLEEAWIIIWPWNVEHPAFLEGVDLQKLADAYHTLTGKTLPIGPAPTPAPVPTPIPAIITPEDKVLWAAIQPWSVARHVGSNKRAAQAAIAWAKAKGLV